MGSGLVDISYEPAWPEVCVAVEDVESESCDALDALEKEEVDGAC